MTDAAATDTTRAIVVDHVLPHPAAVVWQALTSGALIGRWLMEPTGFEAVVGARFTFQTTPGGRWDGVIHCQVLEVMADRRLSYSWSGGHPDNVGYGAPLETVVTFELEPTPSGTRLRLTHAGFQMPRNEGAYRTMSDGWRTVVGKLGAVAGDVDGGRA